MEANSDLFLPKKRNHNESQHSQPAYLVGEDILLEGETTESEEEVQKKRPRFTEDHELDSLISQVPPNTLQNPAGKDETITVGLEEHTLIPAMLAAKQGSKSQEQSVVQYQSQIEESSQVAEGKSLTAPI